MKLMLSALLLTVGSLCAEDKKDDKTAFQGTWTIVERKKADNEPLTAPTVVFEGDKYKIKAGDKVVEEGSFTLDSAKKHIEVVSTEGMDKGKKWHGIYEIEGDNLKAVVGPIDKERPTKYDDPPEGVRAFVLKRDKK